MDDSLALSLFPASSSFAQMRIPRVFHTPEILHGVADRVGGKKADAVCAAAVCVAVCVVVCGVVCGVVCVGVCVAMCNVVSVAVACW